MFLVSILTWFELWCFQLSINGNKIFFSKIRSWSIFCLKRTLGNSSDFHLLIITWFASVPKASALWGSCQAVEHGPLLVSWLPRDPAVHWFGSGFFFSFFFSPTFLLRRSRGTRFRLRSDSVDPLSTLKRVAFILIFSNWSLSHLDASSIRR